MCDGRGWGRWFSLFPLVTRFFAVVAYFFFLCGRVFFFIGNLLNFFLMGFSCMILLCVLPCRVIVPAARLFPASFVFLRPVLGYNPRPRCFGFACLAVLISRSVIRYVLFSRLSCSTDEWFFVGFSPEYCRLAVRFFVFPESPFSFALPNSTWLASGHVPDPCLVLLTTLRCCNPVFPELKPGSLSVT